MGVGARRIFALLLVLLVIAPTAAHAGDLGDFEKGLRTPAPSGPKSPDSPSRRHDSPEFDDDDDCVEEFSDILPCMLFYAVASIVEAASEATMEYAKNEREPATPVVPIVRLENTYQSLIDADIDGYTLRGELGWGAIGVAGGWTRYSEERPPDELDSWFVEGLWRFGWSEYYRFDVAAGARGFERAFSTKGFQWGVSTGLYPVNFLGLEGDARWAFFDSGQLTDLRGALRLTYPDFPYASVRAGYRYIGIGDQKLHGPEVGLVLTW